MPPVLSKYRGRIVDVIQKRIYDGKIVVEDGIISSVMECALPSGPDFPYIMPGFIDSHVHIESSTDDVIVRAINRVIEMQGGQVAIADEEMTEMALPIAGLMSPLDGHEVAYRCRLLSDVATLTGCTMKAPFITMAFLCLPVIQEIRITNNCLWDSKEMERIIVR